MQSNLTMLIRLSYDGIIGRHSKRIHFGRRVIGYHGYNYRQVSIASSGTKPWTQPLLGWSMSKSVTNALVGVLVKKSKSGHPPAGPGSVASEEC